MGIPLASRKVGWFWGALGFPENCCICYAQQNGEGPPAQSLVEIGGRRFASNACWCPQLPTASRARPRISPQKKWPRKITLIFSFTTTWHLAISQNSLQVHQFFFPEPCPKKGSPPKIHSIPKQTEQWIQKWQKWIQCLDCNPMLSSGKKSQPAFLLCRRP